MRMTSAAVWAASALLASGAAAAGAHAALRQLPVPDGRQALEQRLRQEPDGGYPTNVPYDGRFTFVRIRFTTLGGPQGWFEGKPDVKWDHDVPRAERHFARILTEVSAIRPYMGGSNILTLDDPELTKFPIAYLCEPGFWDPSDAEVLGLRNYLLKGGFIIFDDFFGGHWYNFETQIKKVLPQARLVPIDASHPIFDSFFHITSLDFGEFDRRGMPQYYAIFEDNDPAKRIMAIVNYNNDIGEYWEWSDIGNFPVPLTNEAYEIGVNYIVYAMTH